MAYTKTNWKDRAVERPRTYRMQNNPDGTVTLIPMPGTVYEPGTPVNAPNLNKIEQGIVDATVEAINWAKSFGLGGAAKVIPGQDLNNINTTGFYCGDRLNNAPSNDWWWVIVIQHASSDYCLQFAFAYHADSVQYRKQIGGGWGQWKYMFHSGNFNPGEKLTRSGDSMTGPLTLHSSHGLSQFKTGSGDGANYTTHNFRLHGHWGMGMEDHSGAINGYYDFRSGRWVTKGGFSVNDGTSSQVSLEANGDIWIRGTKLAPTRVNDGVMEFWDGGAWRPVGGIKRVQRGEVTTVSGTNPYNITISAVDMAKSFVTFNNAINVVEARINVRAYLTSPTNLQISMNHTVLGGDWGLVWEVVESY